MLPDIALLVLVAMYGTLALHDVWCTLYVERKMSAAVAPERWVAGQAAQQANSIHINHPSKTSVPCWIKTNNKSNSEEALPEEAVPAVLAVLEQY